MGVQATDFITALGKRRDSEKRANATSAKINCYTPAAKRI